MRRFASQVAMAILTTALAHGQPATTPPAFEVADIKPSDPSVGNPGKGRILPGGRIEVPGMTVKDLIIFAYGVQENMIQGGPKWAYNDRFDLVAKAAGEPAPPTLRLMLQTLLAERFKLVIHREDKVSPVYVLSVGKRALKLQEGSGEKQDCGWTILESGNLRRRECHNLSMEEFAKQLPGLGGAGIDLPVVDQTGLKGVYDFHFDMGFPGRGEGKGEGGRGGDAIATLPDTGPNIFTALDQIGLKLESRKLAVPIVVIDSAQSPTGN